MPIGQFVQKRPGLGGGSEDAADGGQGEGAETDSTLKGSLHVVAAVMGQQSQELLGLQFAVGLLLEQTL